MISAFTVIETFYEGVFFALKFSYIINMCII